MDNYYEGKRLVDERYACIVCTSESSSIEDLHNHQKYDHTSEELSLSVIRLVQYICFKNEALRLEIASKYPTLLMNDPANNHLRQIAQNHLYHMNAMWDRTQRSYISFHNRSKMMNNIGQDNCHAINSVGVNNSQLVISSLEIELSKVKEISDETFLNCVNGICKELSMMRKSDGKEKQVQRCLIKKNFNGKEEKGGSF